LIQPEWREDRYCQTLAAGFCCLGILDDQIQFYINQVAPVVHMLCEGGHIVRFRTCQPRTEPGT
jgi:hypothetical protein